MQAAAPTVQVTVTVTDTAEEETPRRFSRAELEDMACRWDFDENECACRDLLIAAFPEAVSLWSEEELAEMDTMDLLLQTGQRKPETALEMVKLLRSTAEEHLQDQEAANQLLGWDMHDLLVSDDMLPLLIEELKQDDCLPVSSSRALMWDGPRRQS